eukprot:TRINITY_DN462_c0_g1_i1.p1 TRINITY_DN462_c0_g1~~TRINITY_DN462_c0_g1_i1.p1  ORF type:complete len:398 (-),score=41.53 TRINITY_DN462_c0_g1_i1:803-1996(-)
MMAEVTEDRHSRRQATGGRVAADNPVVTLASLILGFMPPSLMLRSTCRAFRSAADKLHDPEVKHLTVAADAAGSLSLIQWAVQNGLKRSMARCSCIRRGDLTGLRLLDTETSFLFWQPEHTYVAARQGHLAVLQWLHANSCPWDSQTCSEAAAGGHLAVLQWLRSRGCPWFSWTCAAAAGGGHLEVLQWARTCRWLPVERGDMQQGCSEGTPRGANGCPWDENVCLQAAGGGHLELLQWARANGCQWEEIWTACHRAARAGHFEMLRWLHANGCPWNEYITSGAQHAATVRCCSGRLPTDAPGTTPRVWRPYRMGILTCYSGHMPMAAHWAGTNAPGPQREGSWRFCSGYAPLGAHGASGRAALPLREGTWRCCSGHVPMAARGARRHAAGLQRRDT